MSKIIARHRGTNRQAEFSPRDWEAIQAHPSLSGNWEKIGETGEKRAILPPVETLEVIKPRTEQEVINKKHKKE